MQQRLKQRLIGAVVLVALAVIFIPMLLQGPVERQATSIPIEIPPQPVVNVAPPMATSESPSAAVVTNPFTASTPVDPASERQSQTASQQPSPAAETVSVPEPKLEPEPQTPPDLAAWAVQVGSFGTEANALSLRDTLRGKGYGAYTEAVRSDGKAFYRVRVGPTMERTEAEKLKTALAGKESLKGLIVPHP